ncbi:MAG: hypothetical protein E7214_08255 [Clostridium sp.]|nr:hypothetical protein [Clostridium sp.]
MNTQISFLGEDVKVEPKAKKFDFLLQQLQSLIEDKDKEIEALESRMDKILEENRKLKEKLSKPKVLAIDCFKVPRNGRKTNLNYFLGQVHYKMFIKDGGYETFDDDKKSIYKEVWNKCVVPTYKEYMKYHWEEQDKRDDY